MQDACQSICEAARPLWSILGEGCRQLPSCLYSELLATPHPLRIWPCDSTMGSAGSPARLAGLILLAALAAAGTHARALPGRELLQCEVSSTAVAGSSR